MDISETEQIISNAEIASAFPGGVISFVDVLGWQGIYYRNRNAIEDLKNVLNQIRSEAGILRGLHGVQSETSTLSISDSIGVFTLCDKNAYSIVLEKHGEILSKIMGSSLGSGLPLRGTCTVGEFQLSEGIFVGPAVDEAAGWYNQADWIGVHMTPSAELMYQKSANSLHWKLYAPPLRGLGQWKFHCLVWGGSKSGLINLEAVRLHLSNLGPVTPNIAGKHINTLDFLKSLASPSKADRRIEFARRARRRSKNRVST